MCLLNVPYRPFPRVLSSRSAASSRTSASTTSIARTAQARPLAGVSLAECLLQHQTHVMSPSSPTSSATWIRSTRRSISPTATTISCALDDATMIPTSPEGLPNSEASSSSKQAAACRVSSPSEFVVSGNRVQVMCRVVLAPRKLEPSWWENLLRQRFLVHSRKGKEIETRCAFVEREKISKTSFNGKVIWPSEEREKLSKYCIKLRLMREIGKGDIPTLLLERSIKNLNLSDFSYIKQVHGQIGLRETKLTCMEIWNWEIGSSKKIMQGIAKTSKNWEEFVAKKLIKQSKQELKNCLCNNTGIFRLRVKWWFTFGIYRTK